MRFSLGAGIAFVWFVAFPLGAGADDSDVENLLRRMADAVRLLDYQGTFVYLQNNQLEAMHIMHVQTPDGERERLVSLNGSAREVVREGETVTCILPEKNAVLVDQRYPQTRFPDLLPVQLRELSRHYSFRILGEDRVAGRNAVVVGIIPKDQYRYGYRLYLDKTSALPLKSDLMDETGVPLEQFMFTQLEVIEPPAQSQVLAADLMQSEARAGEERATEADPEESAVSLRWTFENLPRGFAISAHEMRSDTTGNGDVEHYVLTDGLASLSVFVEEPGSEQGLEGDSRMGAINASGAQVEGFRVTVVGEVPLLTVRQVMQGLRQAGSGE